MASGNGNIIGENFSPSVTKQIDIRQSKLKEKDRNQDVITWSNSTTAFLRLSSCVNLDTGGEGANDGFQQNEIQSQARNIAQSLGDTSLGGSELARRSILWNGLTTVMDTVSGGNEAIFREGINTLHPDSIWNNSAYGFGGNDMGYRPMPGLVGAKLTYYNMGALKKAQIQAKVFNVKQLEIIDTLYMRLGYNILLEWGHTIYFDNKGRKQTMNNLNTIPFEMVFPTEGGSTKSIFDILGGIEEEREIRSNNYDAFFGQVSKFNWTFNEDGSYNITIEAISHGDIIESLKINNNYPNIEFPQIKGAPFSTGNYGGEAAQVDSTSQEYEGIGVKDVASYAGAWGGFAVGSTLGSAFGPLGYLLGGGIGAGLGYFGSNKAIEKIKDTTSSEIEKPDFIKQDTKELLSSSPTINKGMISVEESSNFKLKSLFERYFTTQKQKLKQGKKVVVGGMENYEEQFIKYKYGVSQNGEDNNKYYVKLGILLEYIQQNLLIYNGISEEKIPYVKIDTNSSLNYCLSFDNHFSSNPSVCIIPFKYGLKSPSQQTQTDSTLTFSPSLKTGDSPIENTFTPPINLQPQANNEAKFLGNISSVTSKVTRTTGTQFIVQNNPYVGKLMHIHVNIDYLINLMERLKGENGEVNLFDFLQTTMNDIASSLGNINNFNVTYDTETNYLKIYDNNNLNYLGTRKTINSENDVPEFESYGISKELGGSFLKSINFTVTINNSFSQLVTIGAQANSNVSGINSTGLNSLNRGLIDRVFPTKVDIEDLSGGKQEANYNIKTILKAAYSIYIKGNITGNNLKDISDGHTDYCKDKINEAANLSYIPSPFFLPFTLTTSMLGLSGMKNYQKFRIQEDILPSTYKTTGNNSKIEFIARGVTHEINNNKWVSTLDAITVPVQTLVPFPSIGNEMVQDFSTDPPTGPPMSIKLQAILDTIAWAEGTIKYGQFDGYNVLFGGKTFNDNFDHPWNIYPQPEKFYFNDNGVQNWSTAAGRYQFLQKTWNQISSDNLLRSFNESNQDIGAILLAISKQNFLESLETEDYEKSFDSIKEIWASLPAAGYGQPEKKMIDTLNYFENLLVSSKYLKPEVENWIELIKPNILNEGKTF